MYLLDTHTLLWMRQDDPRLSRSLWEPILFAPETKVYVSIASFWEIAIKKSLKKLTLDGSVEELARSCETDLGFRLLPIEASHLERLQRLPHHHRDPFDRLLIAQAAEIGATAITNDPRWNAYPIKVRW